MEIGKETTKATVEIGKQVEKEFKSSTKEVVNVTTELIKDVKESVKDAM
ncbi:hypothetical protein [Sulfolobus sp. S-194]|nr:hypothetical protein [Sulfolobus sp. S-194]